MSVVSKSCVHNNCLHNQAAPTLSCLTPGAAGVFFLYLILFLFSSPALSPQHSALFVFVCVWCVRTCDEKLYGLHPAKESPFLDLFLKIVWQRRWKLRRRRRWAAPMVVVSLLADKCDYNGWWLGEWRGVVLCKVGIIVGFWQSSVKKEKKIESRRKMHFESCFLPASVKRNMLTCWVRV